MWLGNQELNSDFLDRAHAKCTLRQVAKHWVRGPIWEVALRLLSILKGGVKGGLTTRTAPPPSPTTKWDCRLTTETFWICRERASLPALSAWAKLMHSTLFFSIRDRFCFRIQVYWIQILTDLWNIQQGLSLVPKIALTRLVQKPLRTRAQSSSSSNTLLSPLWMKYLTWKTTVWEKVAQWTQDKVAVYFLKWRSLFLVRKCSRWDFTVRLEPYSSEKCLSTYSSSLSQRVCMKAWWTFRPASAYQALQTS